MSKKFIRNRESTNFVFPNKKINEYGIEIIHDINDNAVNGTINTLSITSFDSDSIDLYVNVSLETNGAELYVNPTGGTQLFAVYLMDSSDENFYKPWKLVYVYSETGLTSTYSGGTYTPTINITKEQLGVDGITGGNFKYEIRFIGKRYVDILCGTVSALAPTPTPTITPTPSQTPGLTPTPTPSITPTITPTPSSGVLNLTQYCYSVLYVCGDSLHCEAPDYTNCASITYWDEYGVAHAENLCRDDYPNGYSVYSSAVPITTGMGTRRCTTCSTPSISDVTQPSAGVIFIDRGLSNRSCTGTIVQYSSTITFDSGTYVEILYSDYCGDITLDPFPYGSGTWYFRIKEICDGVRTSDWSNTKAYTF